MGDIDISSRIHESSCHRFGEVTVISSDAEVVGPYFYRDLSQWLTEWNEWYIANVIMNADDCIHLYSRSLTLSGWEEAKAKDLITLDETCCRIGLPLNLATTIDRIEKFGSLCMVEKFKTLNQIYLEFGDCSASKIPQKTLEIVERVFSSRARVTLIGPTTQWLKLGILDSELANSTTFTIQRSNELPEGVDVVGIFIDPYGNVYPSLSSLSNQNPWCNVAQKRKWSSLPTMAENRI